MSHTKSARSQGGHPSGPLDKRDAFFTNLLLLGFDRGEMEGRFNVPFSRDMFALPNKKCFEVVMHFLFERLNPAMADDKFRYCWPITEKKQEQAFRKVVNSWLTEIKEEEDSFLPRIVPSLFLSPGGDKFYTLLLQFSRYVIQRVILTENGAKARDLLLYPQSPTKDHDMAGQVGKALQACCVKHRKSFLVHLETDLILQDQWSSYASDLVSEYRRLTKEIRDLEQQIRQEEARLMEQANARGNPSMTRRRRSGALLDAEWDTMAVRRTQKVQKVREMWKSVEACHAAQRPEREVVDSILKRAANQYRVDGTELNVQVPEMLLRECQKEIEMQNIGNTYQGGKLNLLSLIQLWNLSLRLYLEKLHQAPPADFDVLQPEVVTQVHTHHAHLTNLQALRSSMGQEVLPSIKSSVQSLKRQLELGYEAPTRDRPSKMDRSAFLGDSLGLLPATPPISFEPASTVCAADDTPMRPVGKPLWKASPTIGTPEAVSSLLQTVNRAVQRQGNLAQGTPTSTLKILRDQINRPSRLPKPVPADVTSEKKPDRRRVKSAPAKTSSGSSQEQSHSEEDSTLKFEDTTHSEVIPSAAKPDKPRARTQQKSVSRESRTGAPRDAKRAPGTASKTTARKSDRKTATSKSSKKTPAQPQSAQSNRTPVSKPRDEALSSSVTRAHQVLIDQIADAVVGAMSGSPEYKGLIDTPPSSSKGADVSPIPMGVEDPLSVLDQSAFVTRDKLKHSPITTPAQHITPSAALHPAYRSPHAVSGSHQSPLRVPENVQQLQDSGSEPEDSLSGKQSDVLQGMETEVPAEHKTPVGRLINISFASPADLNSVKDEVLLTGSPHFRHGIPNCGQGVPPGGLNRSDNVNNSGVDTPSGPSPFRLNVESLDLSTEVLQDAHLSLDGSGLGALISTSPGEQHASPLGVVEMDQQLSEIFGTRTPQLPDKIKGRASSASPGLDFTGDLNGSSSPGVEDAVGRLNFGSSPIMEETPEILDLDASGVAVADIDNQEIHLDSPVSEDLVPTGIMSSRKVPAGSKQRASNGSQKSVTFSDHVDEHNISSRSIYNDPSGSELNGDVFVAANLLSSPSVPVDNATHHVLPTSKTNGHASFTPSSARDAHTIDDLVSPSPKLCETSGDIEISPLDKLVTLDDTAENGIDDFLLDTSSNLEDLLVHISPAVSPSATPKLSKSRAAQDQLSDTSFGSAPNSITRPSFQITPHLNDSSRFSLPANISGLSMTNESHVSLHDASLLRDLSNLQIRTPGMKATPSHKPSPLTRSPLLQTTPRSTIDFDLLDEDESVLLPPSPYAQSPASQSPAGALGQLIDI